MNKSTKHLPKKRQKEPKWFQKQISAEDFVVKTGKNGKIYGHHKEWKNAVWIGPYETEEEINKVIASYVSVTKKPFGQRKEIKNIHSIIINEKNW